MPDWKRIISQLKRRGVLSTVIWILSLLAIGVFDNLTAKIIPAISQKIENFYDPHTANLSFDEPIVLAERGLYLRKPSEEADPEGYSRYDVVSERSIVVYAEPDNNIMTGKRINNGPGEIARDAVGIQRRGEKITVKFLPNDWKKPGELARDLPAAPPTQSQAAATDMVVASTRWVTTADDFAVLSSISDKGAKELLGAALIEVGVDENGTQQDKDRISDYWRSVAGWSTPTEGVPWGGAFLSWVVTRAGFEPPRAAPSFLAWQNWGVELPQDDVRPGTLAIFRRANLPEASSRLLIGVVLRKQRDCIEIITGNVADHVAISCIKGDRALRAPDSKRVAKQG